MYPKRGLLDQPLARRKVEHHPANDDLQQQRRPYRSDADAFFID